MTVNTSDLHKFFVYSINFEKANAETRGKFSFFLDQVEAFSENLKQQKDDYAFIISTCNRTELYIYSDTPEKVLQLYLDQIQCNLKDYLPYTTFLQGKEALNHLFRVSSGLESQILGDFEIVSQLKKWVKKFKKYGATNYFLEKAVNTALQLSKQVKSETLLSNGTASVSFAAVNYLLQSQTSIENITLLGTGKIGQNTVENLVKHFPNTKITVVNRTDEKAEKLAKKFPIEHEKFENISKQIAETDVLIVSTNAANPIINNRFIEGDRPLVILDLSVPKNVEISLEDYPNISILNVDDLSATVDKTLMQRREEIPLAEEILEQYLEEFLLWDENRKYAPVIKNFKQKLDFLNDFHAKNLRKNNVKINGTETILAEKLAQKMTNRFAEYVLENPDKADEISDIIINIFQLDNKDEAH